MKVPVVMVRLSISPFLSAVKFSLIRYAGQLSRAKRPAATACGPAQWQQGRFLTFCAPIPNRAETA